MKIAWITVFLIVCFCLAFSAFYELIEWAVAVVSGTGAEAFLGTQGYVWDTQSDMAFALLGAILALILLGRRSIRSRSIAVLSCTLTTWPANRRYTPPPA